MICNGIIQRLTDKYLRTENFKGLINLSLRSPCTCYTPELNLFSKLAKWKKIEIKKISTDYILWILWDNKGRSPLNVIWCSIHGLPIIKKAAPYYYRDSSDDRLRFIMGVSVPVRQRLFNTLKPRQNGRHFPDDIFDCIFLNENVRISLAILLKFVPRVRIIYIPALVPIMAWRRPGDKPLSEPMMIILQTHMCVIRPQWMNRSTSSYKAINTEPSNKLINRKTFSN